MKIYFGFNPERLNERYSPPLEYQLERELECIKKLFEATEISDKFYTYIGRSEITTKNISQVREHAKDAIYKFMTISWEVDKEHSSPQSSLIGAFKKYAAYSITQLNEALKFLEHDFGPEPKIESTYYHVRMDEEH